MRSSTTSGSGSGTPTRERRRRRTDLITAALGYQLSACCDDGAMHAMVVADEDGLALAASGDRAACEEIAASMVHLAARTDVFRGTLMRAGQHWDIEMAKLRVDGSDLMIYAIGGTAEQRSRQVSRGARGALRILGAA